MSKSDPHVPIISPDTLRSKSRVQIVDLISEGPVLGLATNDGKSILFNDVALQGKGGGWQVKGVLVHFRHGTPVQDPIPGWPAIENSYDVNQPIKSQFNSLELLVEFDTINDSDTRTPIVLGNYLGNPGTGIDQTSVPTVPIEFGWELVPDPFFPEYKLLLTNPGQNLIAIPTIQLFNVGSSGWANFYLDFEERAQLVGGVMRTITNNDVDAVRFTIKIDKLFKENGVGDISPTSIRFVIQQKHHNAIKWENVLVTGRRLSANPTLITFSDMIIYSDESVGFGVPVSKIGVYFTTTLIEGLAVDAYLYAQIRITGVTTSAWVTAATDSPYTTFMPAGSPASGPKQNDVDFIHEPSILWEFPLPIGAFWNFDEFYPVSGGGDPVSYEVRVFTSDAHWVVSDVQAYFIQEDQAMTPFTITGKTTGGAMLDYRIELPKPRDYSVDIRVLRLTEDDPYQDKVAAAVATDRGVDPTDEEAMAAVVVQSRQMTWQSYTEIIDHRIMYSDSCVCGLELDTQYIGGSVPKRAYDLFGRIVRVPSNYDSTPNVNGVVNRTYTGIWDGTFHLAWSDNPVWIFLDLVTHDRYGLGNWITDDLIDMSSLYQIARYCDETVDDGPDGNNPRFTFNTQITSAESAYNVLSMLSSVFRGMIYWAAGSISLTQDSPTSPSRVVTPANVLSDGAFSYAGSALNARHSVVLVTWTDPDNFYKEITDVFEDPELVARYGYITTELRAWGCVKRGQALRMARWVLDTEKFATDVVTYRAGFDHADARPGEVIAVADPMITGFRFGGRVISALTTALVMDAAYVFDGTQTYTITVQIPTWGRVSVLNGSSAVMGNRTQFNCALKPIHAGDVIVFHGQATQYQVSFVSDAVNLNLVTPYTGDTLTDTDFTVFRANAFYYSSRIPVVEAEIVSVSGEQTQVDFVTPLPVAPNPNANFLITGSDAQPRLFRIFSNREIDTHTYEINALQHDPTKFDRVETAA